MRDFKDNGQLILLGDQKEFEQSGPLSVWSQLSDYHFSSQRIPSRSASIKKYILMLLGAFGGLGYWGVIDKYNKNHEFSDFIAISNNVGVAFSSGFFLLQSVDLAKELLDELAGSIPEPLHEILEVAPLEQRKSIKFKTGLASSVSGFPFLIIALVSTLPPIASISSEVWRDIGIGVWGAFFYVVSVGLHILPFAVLQSPGFWYYRLPLTFLEKLFSGCKCLAHRTRSSDQIVDVEIAQVNMELKNLYNEIRGLIADRVSTSLDNLVQEVTRQISFRCRYDCEDIETILSEGAQLERLLFLLEKYPPSSEPRVVYPRITHISRIFGAQLQLGAGFTWWTNVFQTLSNIFTNVGLQPGFAYFLAGILGALPSYALIVILAFFGEIQMPRLINYLINLGKKLLGFGHTEPLLHPAAKLNPLLFGVSTLAIGFITYFSPVNAISVNEQQYQDVLPDDMMMVLKIYADIGIPILTCIALLDLYFRYQTETLAVFGTKGSYSQKLAHLLLVRESLPRDIRKLKPKELIPDLKKLDDRQLKLLLGEDKEKTWVFEQEKKEQDIQARLRNKEIEKLSVWRSTDGHLQEGQNQNAGGFFNTACAFFSKAFCCCRKKPREQEEFLLYSSQIVFDSSS